MESPEAQFPDVEEEIGAEKDQQVVEVMPAQQLSNRVTGRQRVHAQHFSEIFVKTITIDASRAAEAWHFLKIAPPNFAQPDQKILQHHVAIELVFLAHSGFPGAERGHGKDAIGLLADSQSPAVVHRRVRSR